MSANQSNSNGIFFGPPAGYIEPHLYTPEAIWRFTLLWTLLLMGSTFAAAGLLCVPIFAKRHLRLSLIAPLIFIVYGLLAAFITATVVGYVLAALYNAAFLRMSTWVPALWAFISTATLLMTSAMRGTI